MDFFRDLIWKRLKEHGWPKSPGWFSKKVITEDALAYAAQDAVCIAITIGSTMPKSAESIVIPYVLSPTKRTVNDWINKASDDGEVKLKSDLPPDEIPWPEGPWIKLCQLWWPSLGNSKAPPQLVPWFGGVLEWKRALAGISPRRLEHERAWDDPQIEEMITGGRNNSLAAVAWAFKHPDKCVDLFDQSTFGTQYTEDDGIQPRMPHPQEIYDKWLIVAKDAVSHFEATAGLRSLEDLPSE